MQRAAALNGSVCFSLDAVLSPCAAVLAADDDAVLAADDDAVLAADDDAVFAHLLVGVLASLIRADLG